MPIQQMLLGVGAKQKTYVDDVFNVQAYIGTGSSRTITNGIDLSTEGGLVWTKCRLGSSDMHHMLFDTERGVTKDLITSAQGAQGTSTNMVTAFNTNGYSLGNSGYVNENNSTYSSWIFRKSPGFFDIVTYTGSSSARTISHNLGSVPGAIFIKKLSGADYWAVYHRKTHASSPEDYYTKLNEEASRIDDANFWNDTAPTASVFSLGDAGAVNSDGHTYIAYLFAHDDQSFGEGGDQSIIKCGTIEGTGGGHEVFADLGWEPQWILYKSSTYDASGHGSWFIFDAVRGLHYRADNESRFLTANSHDREGYLAGNDWSSAGLDITSTGFTPSSGNQRINRNNEHYIYIAIRRPDGYVGKPVDAGTDVLSIGTRSGSSSNALAAVNTFVDFSLIKNYGAGEYWAANARVMDNYTLKTDTSSAKIQGALPTSGNIWDRMLGHLVAGGNGATNSTSGNMIDYGWKRHAGFDVVSYTGNSSNRQISHSLNAAPEMMWVKQRSSNTNWAVYHSGVNGGTNPEQYRLTLNEEDSKNDDNTVWNDTAPTATHFSLGTHNHVNNNQEYLIALLFASVSGISKVGRYTGTGDSLTITTGFQPRFLIIKNTDTFDSNSTWYVLDTTRGWGSGNDNYMELDKSDAQGGHDFGAPTSTGFTLTSSTNSAYNKDGDNFIYYAHA